MSVWEELERFWCSRETKALRYRNAIAFSPCLHRDGSKIIYAVGCDFPEEGGIFQYDINDNKNETIVLWKEIPFLVRLRKNMQFYTEFVSMYYNKTDNKVIIFAEGGHWSNKVTMEYALNTKKIVKFTDGEEFLNKSKVTEIGCEPTLYFDENNENVHIIGGVHNCYHLRYQMLRNMALGSYLKQPTQICKFPTSISHHRIIKNPKRNQLMLLGGFSHEKGFLNGVYIKKLNNPLVINGYIRNMEKLFLINDTFPKIMPKVIYKICLKYLGDISKNQWIKSPIKLPHKMADFGCVLYRNYIIIFGGTSDVKLSDNIYINRDYNSYLSSIYRLNLSFRSCGWKKSEIELPKDIRGNCVAVLNPKENTVHLIDRTYGKHFKIGIFTLFSDETFKKIIEPDWKSKYRPKDIIFQRKEKREQEIKKREQYIKSVNSDNIDLMSAMNESKLTTNKTKNDILKLFDSQIETKQKIKPFWFENDGKKEDYDNKKKTVSNNNDPFTNFSNDDPFGIFGDFESKTKQNDDPFSIFGDFESKNKTKQNNDLDSFFNANDDPFYSVTKNKESKDKQKTKKMYHVNKRPKDSVSDTDEDEKIQKNNEVIDFFFG